MPIDLIIIAGGQSRRMGHDKARLIIPSTGEPQIRYVARRLALLPVHRTIIVADHHSLLQPLFAARTDIFFLADAYPNSGPLGGVATGLAMCDGWAVVIACDMPLVNPVLFQRLIEMAHECYSDGRDRWDAVVPLVHEKHQSLHALYHQRCLPAMTVQLLAGRYRMSSFLADVRTRLVSEDEVRAIDPTLRSFTNANTPAEWQKLCEVL